MYLLKEFEENPAKIWESIFLAKACTSLSTKAYNKLYRMPGDARDKVRETIERIINDGCNGLICIFYNPLTLSSNKQPPAGRWLFIRTTLRSANRSAIKTCKLLDV